MPSKTRHLYSGQHVSPKRKAQIIAMLCAGESINEIHRQTRAHEFTIRAIEFNHSRLVEERKKILADSALEGASESLTVLRSQISERLSPQQLVPIFGVLVDKAIALRSDPTIHVEHSHQHIHAHITESSYHDLLAKLRAKKSGNQASPQALQDKPKG